MNVTSCVRDFLDERALRTVGGCSYVSCAR